MHLVFITICFSQLDHFHILRKLQNTWEVICKIKVLLVVVGPAGPTTTNRTATIMLQR